MKAATARFPCVWCKIDILEPDGWNEEQPSRHSDDKPQDETGQPRKNLFPFIPRDRWRLDVLHLLLRCMDRFVHSAALLYLRIEGPTVSDRDKQLSLLNRELGPSLARAAGQQCIRFAPISNTSNLWSLTRVTGDGYRRILSNFKFQHILPSAPEAAARHQRTWDSFRDVYNNLNTTTPWAPTRFKNAVRGWFTETVDGYLEQAGEYNERYCTSSCFYFVLLPFTFLPPRVLCRARSNLRKMTVNQLRDELKKGGQSCKSLRTKKDFIQLLLRTRRTHLRRNDPLFLASFLLTPYFHCLLSHVHQFLEGGEIYSFSGTRHGT